MPTRIVVAMSGGVDSSVAAALLHEQGYEVIGVTLQLWGKDVCVTSGSRLCCSVRDAMDAKVVAKRLGIRHETLELVEAFRTHVIDYFVDSYRQGLTPNPCIACNDHIKFGQLLEYADTMDAPLLATGHYARVGYDDTQQRYAVKQAADPAKDQSYVLFNLTQAQLARIRFPLGEMSKPRVRELAGSLGFETANKPDSQDICFVRDRNKNGFLRRALNVGDEPGPIVDRDGVHLGTHRGLLGFTIGQREGLGIAAGKPLYVVAMDQPNNRLIVGPRDALLRSAFIAERVNWMSIPPPQRPPSGWPRSAGTEGVRPEPPPSRSRQSAGREGGRPEAAIRAFAKIRSRHQPAAAWITPGANGTARVEFDEPQQAITPGQAVVFYDHAVVLGGGWIAPPAAGSDE